MSLRPLLCTLLCAARLPAAENWPQFRGPDGDGHSDATGLPVTFSETEHVKWKTAVHGKAWSSPVIWGNQIWLSTANPEGTELFVLCVDKQNGQIQRDQLLFRVSSPQEAHRFNSYASPTPVLEEGASTSPLARPAPPASIPRPARSSGSAPISSAITSAAPGSSPIVWKNLLIMNFDGSDLQYVIALDKQTGKTVWKTDRSVDYQDTDADGKRQAEGDFRKAFSTPHVAQVEGRPVLFSSGAKAHYAYNPENGQEYWHVVERAQHSASTRPLVGFGMVYFLTGFSKGQLLAVKMPPAGAVAPPELGESDIAWRVKKACRASLPRCSSTISSTPSTTPASPPASRRRPARRSGASACRANYSSSPIYAQGHIYVATRRGKSRARHRPRVQGARRKQARRWHHGLARGLRQGALLRTKSSLYRLEE